MASVPTVLVYEYFTGGGCPGGPLPGSPFHDGLASEALGMLWAILTDFHRWKAVHTIAPLDPRFDGRFACLSRETFPADEVVCALPGKHEEVYLSLLKRSDAVLIIAPETNGILAKLIAQAETAGKHVLGSSASAAAIAGDKAACARLFRRAKLPGPKTRTADFSSAPQIASRMGFPLVIKPLDGVGSEGVFRINQMSELPAFLDEIRKVTDHRRIVLQSFVSGVHASVSLIAAGGRCLPLSLNRQLIEDGPAFRYLGSEVPFDHPARRCALDLACAAVQLIPGLSGYIGVDMVLQGDRAQVIEINPRLTTSYIGLRQVAQANLAQTIWEACMDGRLPESVGLSGQAIIKKEAANFWRELMRI